MRALRPSLADVAGQLLQDVLLFIISHVVCQTIHFAVLRESAAAAAAETVYARSLHV